MWDKCSAQYHHSDQNIRHKIMAKINTSIEKGSLF